jgi:hypothetical protein
VSEAESPASTSFFGPQIVAVAFEDYPENYRPFLPLLVSAR